MSKKKQSNKNDIVFKVVTTAIVLSVVAIAIIVLNGGKRIVCTKTISNDKVIIQSSYVFRFKNDKLSKIDANVILDYSKDDETTQEAFDEIVNRVNNKDKYENVHINKYNKKADITYNVKKESANLGDDYSFSEILRKVNNDEGLGNCVVK